MPETGVNTQAHAYPMARLGVNLYKNILELAPEECLTSQNLVWKNGMKKRGGQSLFDSTEVVASKKILGLHRFYKSDGTKQTLAACDTVVKYGTGSGWTNAITGLTSGYQTLMSTWGALDKVYICNGQDAMRSWTGAAAATITIPDGIPTQALPYQDRLLTIIGGDLTWSPSFSDTGASWETKASCGVKPDNKLYGMTYHSVSNEAAGFDTKILLAGSNGMYLFWATDMRVPYTTGDYQIFPLSITVGCNAPRTMCWTPKGTIWLGNDKQLYILPFNGVQPTPIGTKLQSNISGIEGIEDIPSAQIQNACAVYHDGYYKLSITRSGGSYNTYQWWLDVKRLYQDDEVLYGPWYGPMTGQSISCFATMNGSGDSGEIIAGEAQTKGYVYYCDRKDVYGDIDISTGTAKDIQEYYQTFYHPLGNPSFRKDVHKIEAELLDVLGTVTVGFYDIDGPLKIGDSFGLSGSTVYWDEAYWDEEYWSSSAPTRQVVDISPAIQPRRLSLIISHSGQDDTFEIYGLTAQAIEQNTMFA